MNSKLQLQGIMIGRKESLRAKQSIKQE